MQQLPHGTVVSCVVLHTSSVGGNSNGTFANYVVVSAFNMRMQPDDLDTDVDAIFNPFGKATHTTELSLASHRA